MQLSDKLFRRRFVIAFADDLKHLFLAQYKFFESFQLLFRARNMKIGNKWLYSFHEVQNTVCV